MDSADLIVISFVAIIFIAVLGFAYLQNKARDERMLRQAEKRGGAFRKGGFFKVAELWIPLNGEKVIFHMEPGSKHSSPKTVARLNLDAPRLPVLRMVHNGLWQKMMASFGQERIITNDEEFDSEWVIRSQDELSARRLVTADLKEKLSDRLFRHLDLRIEPQQLSMTVLTLPSNDEQFDQFIDTAMLIIRKFL